MKFGKDDDRRNDTSPLAEKILSYREILPDPSVLSPRQLQDKRFLCQIRWLLFLFFLENEHRCLISKLFYPMMIIASSWQDRLKVRFQLQKYIWSILQNTLLSNQTLILIQK